jgi:hypothetical protein
LRRRVHEKLGLIGCHPSINQTPQKKIIIKEKKKWFRNYLKND